MDRLSQFSVCGKLRRRTPARFLRPACTAPSTHALTDDYTLQNITRAIRPHLLYITAIRCLLVTLNATRVPSGQHLFSTKGKLDILARRRRHLLFFNTRYIPDRVAVAEAVERLSSCY